MRGEQSVSCVAPKAANMRWVQSPIRSCAPPCSLARQHENRVQKLAEERLAARSPGSRIGGKGDCAAGTTSSQGRKAAPLLYDLVFEAEPDLCIKVGMGASCAAVTLVRSSQVACSDHRSVPRAPYKAAPLLSVQARRDTRNPTLLSCERSMGSWRTTARTAHSAHGPGELAPAAGSCRMHASR
jgi:hypothetical protein